jgi:lipopolysaccharide biosynthesis glycosyltransferase
VDVLCASDQRYLPHAAAMLCSLLEHNHVSKVHLFYSSIADHELEKLRTFIAKYGTSISFYEMALSDFTELPVDKWASAAVYFRLLAPRFLPMELDKILYLDTDIIVRHSLEDLWNTPISGYALAAAPHNEDEYDFWKTMGLPDGTKYFNSGVLLINLKYWRENRVVERAITFVKDNPDKIKFWDQDALNGTLVGKWVELPISWNYRCWWHWSVKDPAILHFAGANKPWNWSDQNPFRHDYRRYRGKTPWPFKAENRPPLPQRLDYAARTFVRSIFPNRLRRWLKIRIFGASA